MINKVNMDHGRSDADPYYTLRGHGFGYGAGAGYCFANGNSITDYSILIGEPGRESGNGRGAGKCSRNGMDTASLVYDCDIYGKGVG